jgi:hypothetical protein
MATTYSYMSIKQRAIFMLRFLPLLWRNWKNIFDSARLNETLYDLF